MQSFLKNNQSQNLILFFSGWGCDENQFVNLNDTNDNVLILFDYQDLNLNFDFSPYKTIDLIAYSAGVFVASILQKSLPPLRQKIAVNGNPYLFDEKFGLSSQTVNVFKSITLDNYLDFRRRYMVISQEEYEKYNELQSLRTLESCQLELEALQKFYALYQKEIMSDFDRAWLYIKGWGKSSTQDYKKYYNQFTTNLFWRTAYAYGYDTDKQRKHQDKRSKTSKKNHHRM